MVLLASTSTMETKCQHREGRQPNDISALCEHLSTRRRIMKRLITIPIAIYEKLRTHLFQNELEQGAFLFADIDQNANEINLEVQDLYLVQPNGWQVQLEVYLEMKDSERAKIMALARKGGYAVIDCHSHPGSDGEVQFSISDRY